MRIDPALEASTLTPHQHFFLSCWFNLSHEASLDSDRVSLSVPLLAARELLALYDFGEHFGGHDKRVDVGLEFHGILEANTILDLPHYGDLKHDLLTHLKPDKNNAKNSQSCTVNKEPTLISSLLHEFITCLEQHYIGDAFAALAAAIANDPGETDDEKKEQLKHILTSANQLAGALIANNASLQDLHAFYRHILNKRRVDWLFDDRFAAFQQAATHDWVQHEVTFTLRSESLDHMMGGAGNSIDFGGFSIVAQGSIGKRNQPTFRASTRINAPSLTIAGSLAHDLLNETVDSLAYTLGRALITIEKRYYAKNLNTEKEKFFEIRKSVPNPNYRFTAEEFKKFIKAMDAAVQGDGIRSAKLSAVFRLMRIAQTTENIEARFVTYWTALESIARDAFTSHYTADANIAVAACSCIAMDYVNKRLDAYLKAFNQAEILEVSLGTGEVKPVKGISHVTLFEGLQDFDFANALLNAVTPYPYFHYQLKRFVALCQNAQDMKKTLAAHEAKVTQQIKRIYRARNLITHKAAKIGSIEFLCAHLEHYLQTCIISMIDMMTLTPTLLSPEEFFIRYRYQVSKVKKALENGDFGPLKKMIEMHQ